MTVPTTDTPTEPSETTPRVVFLDRTTLDMGDVDLSGLEAMSRFSSFDATDGTEAFARHAAGADAVIVNKVSCGEAEMEAVPSMRHIAVIATGVNNVDLDAAARRGIAVTNVAGYARYAVPQHAFALILNLAGRVHSYARDVERGAWAASSSFTLLTYPTFELAGKTLGLIGWGATAQAAARIAVGFGMEVLVTNRRRVDTAPHRRVDLAELLAESDVVSIQVPLTEETRGMIGATELAMMKRRALLVNTARGGIVDEGALLDALEGGVIAGAGLDVLEEEPPRSSVLPARAAGGDLNLIVTPHAAWSAVEARQRLVDEVTANLAAWWNGTERNRVV